MEKFDNSASLRGVLCLINRITKASVDGIKY